MCIKAPMFGKSPVSLKLHVFADCINHSPQNGKVGHLETMRQRSHPDVFELATNWMGRREHFKDPRDTWDKKTLDPCIFSSTHRTTIYHNFWWVKTPIFQGGKYNRRSFLAPAAAGSWRSLRQPWRSQASNSGMGMLGQFCVFQARKIRLLVGNYGI